MWKKWWNWILLYIAIFLAIAALAFSAKADSLILLGVSKHFGTDKPHRERNWGIGWERNDWMAGVYLNSNYRTSVYLLYPIFSYPLTERLTFALPIGAATGYSLAVTPVAIPTFTYRVGNHYHIDVGVMPPIGGKQTIVGAQLRIDTGAFK